MEKGFCCRRGLILLFFVTVLTCHVPQPCQGQRAVASLGSRLKKKFRQNKRSAVEDDYVIQQGKKSSSKEHQGDGKRDRRSTVLLGTALGVGSVAVFYLFTILLDFFLERHASESKNEKKDGE